jgi:dGTPase
VAATYVMLRPGAEAEYVRQREVLTRMVTAMADSDGAMLQTWLRAEWDAAADDAARLRVVLDQVASLTDSSVANWHAALSR